MGVRAQENEAIPWSSKHRLSWTDFKGNIDTTSTAAAVTASGISYSFSSWIKSGHMNTDFTITAYFYPYQSWYHPELCDTVVLMHEQLHFDISELFARKMRDKINQTTFTENIKEEVKSIYNEVLKDLEAFQNLYDIETNFSRNTEKQIEWNQKVDSILKKKRP